MSKILQQLALITSNITSTAKMPTIIAQYYNKMKCQRIARIYYNSSNIPLVMIEDNTTRVWDDMFVV